MCLGSLREEEVSFWVSSCCHYTALYLTTALYVSSGDINMGLGPFSYRKSVILRALSRIFCFP